MDKTRNDLSGDRVRIDYDALISVARYTLASTISTLISTASNMRDSMQRNDTTKYHTSRTVISAQGLEYTVKQLIIAAETYDTLLGGISRDEKVLVNVPKNVEE